MNTFQVLGLLTAAGSVAVLVIAAWTGRLRWRTAIGWTCAWIAAAVAIARPGITVVVANALGIARGADLVSYLGILAGMVGFFLVFVRLRRLDATVTALVRQLALADVREPDASDEGAPRAGR